MRRRPFRPLTATAAGALVLALAGTTDVRAADSDRRILGHFKHLVVIYQENHSFDNLYGSWGSVRGKTPDGIADADLARTLQVKQSGLTFACLPQVDPRLRVPPLEPVCTDETGTPTHLPFTSHFPNRPFAINNYVKRSDQTCPVPGAPGTLGPGGCIHDLVHRFYQEQYQLNGGQQNRYSTGSDAIGQTQGYYKTRKLPIWRYLHRKHAPEYVVADRFFQAAFGGSFLNHQFLIAAAAPPWPGAVSDGSVNDRHSLLDTNGFPTTYPLYTPTTPVRDNPLTQACGLETTRPDLACGDFAVNTLQPFFQPYFPGTPDTSRLPALDDTATALNIGDRLSDKGVRWAWYAGGWDNAAGNVDGRGWTNGDTPGTCTDPVTVTTATYPNCPNAFFQYHHQPFSYFSRYAPGTTDRTTHLKDEKDFLAAARRGHLPAVSFVKPIGVENEHPGYASEYNGNQHLVRLLRAIARSPQARSTLVVVTYDEFGGQWDHVPPPGQGDVTPGPSDSFGPGTRIPTLVISTGLRHSGVDSEPHDTTSIMATIEHAFGLEPLTSRDAVVSDLRSAIRAGGLR